MAPLEKRIISIQFAQGLDQRTEPKLTTKLTTLDNAVMRVTGTVEKRPGFVADGAWSLSANPVRSFPFQNGEFVMTDWSTDSITSTLNASLGSQKIPHIAARVGSTWRSQEYYVNIGTLTQPLSSLADNVKNADIAVINNSATQTGMAICASDGEVFFYDLDAQTKSITSAIGANARFVSLGPQSLTAIGLVPSGTTLQFWRATASTVVQDPNSFNGISSNNPQLDAVLIGSKIYFATKQNSTTGIVIGSFDPAATSNTIATATINATVTPDMLTIATPVAGTDRMRLVWSSNSSNSSYQASYSATLSQILAPTALQPQFFTPAIQIGACENVGATSWDLFFTTASSATYPSSTVLSANYTNTAQGIGRTAATPGCVLAAKPFTAHGQSCVLLNWTATGSQSFIAAKTNLDSESNLHAAGRCLYGIAGPNSATFQWLPEVASSDTDTFWTPVRRAAYFNSTGSQIIVKYSFDLIKLNFSQTQPVPYASCNDVTLLGGGILQEYESSAAFENGFFAPPVILSASATTTGGSLTIGVYSIVAVGEYTDRQGRTHRSAPSLPVTFTTSTTTSGYSIRYFDCPNQKIASTLLQKRIAIFRTQGNGSIYYRDTNILNVTADSVTISTLNLGSVSDASLSGSDIIYTQGGALPNWTPDGVVALIVHQARVFCNDSTDVSTTRFSKEFQPGEGVAFAQANTIRHPSAGGRVTAYGSLDSTLVGFKARMIFGIVGDGPDDTGLNGTFSDGQILFADVGAIDQRNVCRVSAGIVFKSPDKGWYLLTRDLQLQFIGADVQGYNSKTVVSSEVVALAEANGPAEECRFLCSDGTLLIWNYTTGQWSTASLPGCVDAVQTVGRYVVVNTSTTNPSARVFQQSMSTYTDDYSNTSATYQMTAETGWIKTNDTTGFQRIWDVIVFGTAQGPGQLSVDVGYDYEQSYNETYTATMSSLTAPNYSGGNQAEPQMHFKPVRQKCESIRFRVKDIPDPGNTTGVFKLTEISLECGVKPGRFKLPASKDGV